MHNLAQINCSHNDLLSSNGPGFVVVDQSLILAKVKPDYFELFHNRFSIKNYTSLSYTDRCVLFFFCILFFVFNK